MPRLLARRNLKLAVGIDNAFVVTQMLTMKNGPGTINSFSHGGRYFFMMDNLKQSFGIV
jgi:hypothetical protein